MFYESDIEAIGGLFIRERVVEKNFNYELIECLLYVAGEKFRVLLKEYRKGKGIIVDVKNIDDDKFKDKYRLYELLDIYGEVEGAPLALYRKQRANIKIKASFLRGFNFIVLMNSFSKFLYHYEHGSLHTEQGFIAIGSVMAGIALVFIIEQVKQRYIRG